MASRHILPDTLHELLDVAMEDVAALEKDPDYEIQMDETWHLPTSQFSQETLRTFTNPRAACVICAAGATMVRRFHASKRRGYRPSSFGHRNEVRLKAIDWLRLGDVSAAWNILYSDEPFPDVPIYVSALNREVVIYEKDRAQWWEDAMELHMDLRKAGV